MTAAHCGNIPYVVIGGHDQNNPDECAEVLRVVKTVAHPQYDDWTTENDVAVLELERVSAYAPVRAALYQSELAEGRTVTVAGWGTTQEGGSTSSVLRKVNVPVSNQADCYSAYDIVGAMRDTVICAGLEDGGKDSCQGDSGGPLFVPSSSGDGFEIAGIVSFGIGCARPGYAGVYTKVSAFNDWVCNQMGGCAPPTPSAPTSPTTKNPTPAPTAPAT
jgi:secreted trypsin-like serine protease